MKKSNPEVSVCIPVYKTESVLLRCLESVKVQTATNIEIIVVNDASTGTKGFPDAAKITKNFAKSCKKERPDITVKYCYHRKNLGLVEARRTAVLEASAPFIYILDSDDDLLPNCLETLLSAQKEYDADIVHGFAEIMKDNKPAEKHNKGINNMVTELLKGRDILYTCLVKAKISKYLIGKLFRTELYRKAFDFIPHIECTMNEEIIQFFFLCLFADKYIGIETPVFHYNLDSGITSHTLITELDRWEKACSASSVFTTLLLYIEENEQDFTEEEKVAVQYSCRSTLRNRLVHLKKGVAPEIKEEAYEILCKWWGEDFVKEIDSESATCPQDQ